MTSNQEGVHGTGFRLSEGEHHHDEKKALQSTTDL